jgi:hypothetical protein
LPLPRIEYDRVSVPPRGGGGGGGAAAAAAARGARPARVWHPTSRSRSYKQPAALLRI